MDMMEENMEICRICNKEFSNLAVHVRQSHKMTMDEYKSSGEEFDEFENVEVLTPESTDKISSSDLTKNIFSGSVEEKDPNRPLSEFLSEFDVTEKEVRALIRQFKGGGKITVTQQIQNNQEFGEKNAEQYKDEENVSVTNLYVAEALVTKYNFEVTDVRSAKGNRPKTWVLRKK
jgi:hypothetical protein